MINKYTYKNINKKKYTQCLNKSLNYRIYAELWYLDIVSPHGYDILVLNDFEAIMPIPYHKKLGLKFVFQPAFCQQLGVFYKEKISNENFDLFFYLLKKYRVRGYCFNEENTRYFPTEQSIRYNQVLPLDFEYSIIFNNYNKNKKRVVNNKLNSGLLLKENFTTSVINENLCLFLSKSQIDILKSLLYNLNERKRLKQYIVYNSKNVPSVYVWLIFSKDRIIVLFSLRKKNTEVKNSYAYLIDSIIRQYTQQNKILDFEGSMIPGVHNFNKSFGAICKNYVFYKNFLWFEKIKKWFEFLSKPFLFL